MKYYYTSLPSTHLPPPPPSFNIQFLNWEIHFLSIIMKSMVQNLSVLTLRSSLRFQPLCVELLIQGALVSMEVGIGATCFASSRQRSVPSHSHWWGQARILIHGNFRVSPLHKCGISVAHMSMPDRANGFKEGGKEMAAGKGSVHSEGWEVIQGILSWRVNDNILGTRVEGSRGKNEHVKVERCKLETTWWCGYGDMVFPDWL